MYKIKLLRFAGIISLLFTFFHFLFPLMPEWESTLNAMPTEMKSIFITYHYVVIAFLAGIGYISTFQAKSIINNPLKNSLMVMFSALYLIRIITEFTCWKAPMPQAIIVLPLCIIPLTIYVLVLVKKANG